MDRKNKYLTGVVAIAAGFFSLSLVVNTVEARELVDPAPVKLSCKLNQAKMKQGILAGLIGRGWSVVNSRPGRIVARIVVRGKHTLAVTINYSSSSYDIDYKSSDNLKYKMRNGVAYIHKNANSWIQNINNDVRSQLLVLCA